MFWAVSKNFLLQLFLFLRATFYCNFYQVYIAQNVKGNSTIKVLHGWKKYNQKIEANKVLNNFSYITLCENTVYKNNEYQKRIFFKM